MAIWWMNFLKSRRLELIMKFENGGDRQFLVNNNFVVLIQK